MYGIEIKYGTSNNKKFKKHPDQIEAFRKTIDNIYSDLLIKLYKKANMEPEKDAYVR